MAVVTVQVRTEGDYCFAVSDDLPGLNLMGRRESDVLADVPAAIAYLYKANAGVKVKVCRAASASEFPNPVFEDDRFVVSAQAAA